MTCKVASPTESKDMPLGNWESKASQDIYETTAEIPPTSWCGEYLIIYRVLYISGGAGFVPSTVCQELFDKLYEL